VFERFFRNGSGISALSALQSYSVDDLSSHTFTKSEKFMATLGSIDNVITVVSVVAVPLTGGASLALIGGRMAMKEAAKKGIKSAMKVGYRYVRKTASRNVKRAIRRMSGKEGKKAFVREVKELGGLAKKRGRPSNYSGAQAKMIQRISRAGHATESLDNAIKFSLTASGIAAVVYCNQFADHSSKSWARSLCVKDEASRSENICKNFKLGVF